MIGAAISRAVEGRDLSQDEMYEVFGHVMDGQVSDAQKSALLVALRMKGETSDEIAGAARAMRDRVVPVRVPRLRLVDTCGTGGDGSGTFNISTVSAIVAAAAGATVAKHGNRAVSSRSGSADVLDALGVNIQLDATAMAHVLTRAGIAFLFAPKLHPAMQAVAAVRRELGLRTIFNVLGPLTNPAFARRQVLGVHSERLVPIVARVLASLGAEHALVVHSRDGLDEISVSAPTVIAEVVDGELRETTEITPEMLGLRSHPLAALQGGDAAENASIAREVLAGSGGACHDVVIANAAAALYVGGVTDSIREGVDAAQDAIASGRAKSKLRQLIEITNSVGEQS